MRNKNLLIATLVLGVLAFAAVQLNREPKKTSADKQPLVPAALLDSLQTLSIKANSKAVTVDKAADGSWTVREKFSLPADVDNHLTPLIRSLQKANNYGLLTSNAKRLEKLGLTDSSLTLTSTDGKSLALEIGKQTEDGLGNSARLQGQPYAIRTDFTGYLDGDPTSWTDLTLFSAKPEEIKSVSFTWADGKAAYARPAKGQPFAGKEGQAIEEMCSTIGNVRCADVVAKGDKETETAFAKSWQVKLGLFDGGNVVLTFAKLAGKTPNEQGKVFVRVAHSDPKHKTNSLAAKGEFIAQSWLAEQVPASAADFKKSQQAQAEAGQTAPTIQIPGPSPTIVTSPEIKVK